MYKFLLTDASYAVLTVVAFIVLIMGVGAWILSVKDADEAIFGTKLPALQPVSYLWLSSRLAMASHKN